MNSQVRDHGPRAPDTPPKSSGDGRLDCAEVAPCRILFGRSYIDDSGNGVVAVLPPDTPEPDQATVEKIVELHGDRFEGVLQADEQLSALPIPEHAWSRATIGTTERNLPLYQRFGFTIAGEISLTDGPTVWRMHRAQS